MTPAPPAQRPAAASLTSTATPSAGTRRFELVAGESAKFWEVSTDGPVLTVRWGRLGTRGQTQVKDLDNPAAATLQAARLIVQKLAKGYTEVA